MRRTRGFVGDLRLKVAAGLRKFSIKTRTYSKDRREVLRNVRGAGKYPKDLVLNFRDIKNKKTLRTIQNVATFSEYERAFFALRHRPFLWLVKGRKWKRYAMFDQTMEEISSKKVEQLQKLFREINGTNEKSIKENRDRYRFFYVNSRAELVFSNKPHAGLISRREGQLRVMMKP